MEKKTDKDTLEHKAFYEEFLKYTTYTFIDILVSMFFYYFLYCFFK